MLNSISKLQELIHQGVDDLEYGKEPRELYEPIQYIMALGGKRLRPLLTLLSYSMYADDPETILPHALAVEMFHNFTLMHDDIMDQAPLRRGKPTVHEKYDVNTAILSGDVMLVRVYDQFLASHTEQLPQILKAFNTCASEVCEGQQLDMLYEQRENVEEEEYLNMIRLKTAVLLGFSLELGAILADAPVADQERLREFGTLMGIGFQLKDDLLDVYGDHAKFGKQVGGDILANKKTFLLIHALKEANGSGLKKLKGWLQRKEYKDEDKVKAVTAIYDELGIPGFTHSKIDQYFDEAFRSLKKVSAPLNRRKMLREFTEQLMARDH
jgi:geranylgeranyl diphosphate synthase type II